MLRLGVFAWFGYPLPLDKRLQTIKQVGFSTTCLWFGNEEQMVRDGHADEMPELVRNQGLQLDNIHAPPENSNLLWSDSKASRSKIQQELIRVLSFCVKHHIPQMVMHVARGENPPPVTHSGLQLIQGLLSQAENSGVIIALENTKRNDYLDFVFSNIQSPNLGFCYDSGHDFISGQLQGKLLEKWGSLLVATHLSDNFGIDDDHLLPGKGTIDWQAVEKHFPKGSYKGSLMLEVGGSDASNALAPEEFLQIGYQWLRQLANAFNQ
ncbi:MAG TPA: sugar phosphate isomerase/epimerase [Dehalococcoidales bacterium]